MCNQREAKPLYTTITTEYLYELVSARYILDNITRGTVSESHLRMICDSLKKAKTKHPEFCDKITDRHIDKVRDELVMARKGNDFAERSGISVAEDIFLEEKLESEEKYLEGDVQGFKEEICDRIAVEIRMMEKVDSDANRK